MTKPGYIRIVNNEIRFEYHELPKPELKCNCSPCRLRYHSKDLPEYEASKRSVKVENVYWNTSLQSWSIRCRIWAHALDGETIKNNQPCEAEVVNGKATITKIT